MKTAMEEAREDVIHWHDRAKNAEAQVARVRQYAESDYFPCPYPNCEGTIELVWEEERDDGGYVINRYPSFRGECGEEMEVCEDVCEGSGMRPYYPPYACYDKWFNHAELMERDWESMAGYGGEVLARSAERAAVLKQLRRPCP